MASVATIRQADAVVRRRRPELNRAARQIALAIGLLETGFGVDGSWLFDDGTPSYNWGGLVGSGTNGSLVHADRNPDGSPTEYKFKAFHTMDEAFDAFFATWSHGDVAGVGHPEVAHETTVLPAASRGDAYAVATTMYAHGYYGGVSGGASDRISAYARAIDGAARTVASAIGEPDDVSLSGSGGTSTIARARAGAAIVASGIATSAVLAFSAPLAPTIAGAAVFYMWLRERLANANAKKAA